MVHPTAAVDTPNTQIKSINLCSVLFQKLVLNSPELRKLGNSGTVRGPRTKGFLFCKHIFTRVCFLPEHARERHTPVYRGTKITASLNKAHRGRRLDTPFPYGIQLSTQQSSSARTIEARSAAKLRFPGFLQTPDRADRHRGCSNGQHGVSRDDDDAGRKPNACKRASCLKISLWWLRYGCDVHMMIGKT